MRTLSRYSCCGDRVTIAYGATIVGADGIEISEGGSAAIQIFEGVLKANDTVGYSRSRNGALIEDRTRWGWNGAPQTELTLKRVGESSSYEVRGSLKGKPVDVRLDVVGGLASDRDVACAKAHIAKTPDALPVSFNTWSSMFPDQVTPIRLSRINGDGAFNVLSEFRDMRNKLVVDENGDEQSGTGASPSLGVTVEMKSLLREGRRCP